MRHPLPLRRLWQRLAVILGILLLPTLLLIPAGDVWAQPGADEPTPPSISQAARSLRPEVRAADRHDTSSPLMEMVLLPPKAGADVQPWFGLPKAENKPLYGPQKAEVVGDAALPTSFSPATVPGPLVTFEGMNNLNGVLPPDTIGDVGPNHYVQMVNLSMAVYDKQGNVLFGPANTNTIWNGFGGVCQTLNDGDPIVLYDQMADRWMISQFALDFPDNFHECIAISQTPDPTGAWHRYDFKISSSKMNDYPHFGIWPDAYYMAVNQFDGDTFGWQGQGVVAFEREQMLLGQPARMVYFDLYGISDLLGGMLPADWDGMTPPPLGAPNPFVMIDDDAWDDSYPVDQLEVWEFAVDWTNVTNSAFTGPLILPTQFPFDTDVSGAPQPGTSVGLDTIADRLMNRLQYRNFGTHQSMVVNHTVDAGGRAGIRWYELRNEGSGWQIYQEGTYAPDNLYRWMGSMAMDGSGNMALGYSASSSAVFPSIRYTARTATDPLGTLSVNEQEIKAGTGSQTHSAARWGDYSQMSVDPLDECTFWYTTEYIQTTGSAPWRTHIGSFRLPECTGANAGTIAGVITENGSGTPVRNAQVSAGFFNGSTGADGAYALSVPEGTYTVTVSAYGYENATIAGVDVVQDVTTTVDAALTKIPLVTIQGQVDDGSGAGWPVYAEIEIEGYPNSPIYSDPVTGRYSVELLSGIPTTFTVTSALPGYLPVSRTITPTASHPAEDFVLLVDATTCAAPGYQPYSMGVFENFNTAPNIDGINSWRIVDNLDNGQVWAFDDPGDRGNQTGGLDGFATVDSDSYGVDGLQDTELRTPIMDFSGESEVHLAFSTYYRTNMNTDTAVVDVSTDGGVSWTTVYTQTEGVQDGGSRVDLDISALAANQSAVQVRFYYFDAVYEWYWQIDDVMVGLQSCVPSGDGLVMGHVTDANTGQAVNGAGVSDGGDHATTSMDMPLDYNLDGGFFMMAMPGGAYTLTATADRYGTDSQAITITGLAISTASLALPAGRLAVTESVALTLPLNSAPQTIPVALANVGGLDAVFTLVTVEGAQQPPDPALAYASRKRKFPSKLLNDATAVNVYTQDAPGAATLDGGALRGEWHTGLDGAWGVAYDSTSDSLWVNSTASESAQRFDATGTAQGPTADLSRWVTAFAADMAYDPVTRQVWALNVGGDNCLHAFDAATGVDHGDRICPAFTVTQRGLAYNPLRDTFFSGSWNNEIVYEFNRQGQVVSAANLGLAISGLAYNPATDHLFILTNADTGFDVYVVEVNNDSPGGYAILGGFDIQGLDGWDQAGLALDCDGSLWAVDQVSSMLIQADSGEADVCTWAASEWLTVTPETGTVGAGGQASLNFTFNPQTLRPGPAVGAVRLGTNTPYGVFSIPVTLTISHVHQVSLAGDEQGRAGLPGQVVTYSLTVHNSGTITDSFDLALSGNQWNTDSVSGVGPIPLRGSESVVISVTIPATASLGSQDGVTVTLTSQADPTASSQARLTTTAGSFAVSMTPASSRHSGDPGTVVTHTVTITNQGTITDSFALVKTGQIWQTTMPATVGPLAPGEAAAVTISVLIPTATAAGSTSTALLTATSLADGDQTAAAQIETTANAFHRVIATASDGASKTGQPGAEVEYSLLVANRGNVPDTFTIDPMSERWVVSAPTQVGPLAANVGSATIKVRVFVAADAVAAATGRVTITLTSAGDPGASASVVLTTTAATVRSATWGAGAYAAQAFPGETVTVTLTATNTGNISDVYTVTVPSMAGSWPITVTDQIGSLPVGASGSVQVSVAIPASAMPGESKAWMVDLTSQAVGKIASTELTVWVDGYTVFLPHLAQ